MPGGFSSDRMEEQTMAGDELFQKGLKARRQVLGAEYVDANLAALMIS
jgi:hypothetical protein